MQGKSSWFSVHELPVFPVVSCYEQGFLNRRSWVRVPSGTPIISIAYVVSSIPDVIDFSRGKRMVSNLRKWIEFCRYWDGLSC
jgi:hypothetical protein